MKTVVSTCTPESVSGMPRVCRPHLRPTVSCSLWPFWAISLGCQQLGSSINVLCVFFVYLVPHVIKEKNEWVNEEMKEQMDEWMNLALVVLYFFLFLKQVKITPCSGCFGYHLLLPECSFWYLNVRFFLLYNLSSNIIGIPQFLKVT